MGEFHEEVSITMAILAFLLFASFQSAWAQEDWQFKTTGPGGLTTVNAKAGDIVEFEFDATAPNYIYGNFQIEYDKDMFECLSVLEDPNNWYGTWTWWTSASKEPAYGGGGIPYYYNSDNAFAWALQWVEWFGENSAGPVASIDNENGIIRFYTSTYAGYKTPFVSSPLKIVMRVKHTSTAHFTMRWNWLTSYNWFPPHLDHSSESDIELVDLGCVSTVNDPCNVMVQVCSMPEVNVNQSFSATFHGSIIDPAIFVVQDLKDLATHPGHWEYLSFQ